ncbi:inositol monophosphatase [Candidatus Gracilibacteria bacterium]|nr:inositol monophosphatase [Candidatus Gracilibacteria bacterium]
MQLILESTVASFELYSFFFILYSLSVNLIETQKFAENLARKAGELLLKKFGKTKIVVQKGSSDFATDADLASEKLIIREIRKHFPNDGIIAEETASANCKLKAANWIIDPLDGTKNFHFGIPFWCVSIALQQEGESVVGVVFAPLVNQLFSARKGGGAKLNGKKIRVSETAKLADSLVVVEIPRKHTSGKRFEKDVTAFTDSLKKVRRVRAFAAAAYDLCLVARGAIDGYLDFSRSTKIWDAAAGELIVREAGGKITDVTLPNLKFPNVSVLASNAKLHAQLKKLL